MTEETNDQGERPIFVRSFEAEIAEGDGRTIDLRLVPYNTPATVADAPDFKPYREMFLPGSFSAQTRAPDRLRVWLNFEHEQGLRGIVGHGVSLVDGAQDLRGSFRVHENADGDKALDLVRSEILTGASIEFAAIRSRREGGVVQRLRAHLDKVSLCRFPAYADSAVLGVRAQVSTLVGDPPDLRPPNFERLEALGVEPYLTADALAPAWSTLKAGKRDRIAARRLLRLYRLAEVEPPAGLVSMAN